MSLFTTARSAVGVVTRHNDINIVFLLVTVIALMIIPLPTPVVDTLIGVNMALSFTILMMTMYVRTVLDFSVFPTLLLFTTLFRVGLNITTTAKSSSRSANSPLAATLWSARWSSSS